MNAGAEHYRLAATVFDEPGALHQTIRLLIGEGVSIDQLCLVALEHALDRAALADAGGSEQAEQVSTMLQRLSPFPNDLERRDRLATTCTALLETLLHAQRSAAAMAGQSRSPGASFTDLETQIRSGAIGLIVRSSTPAQQSRCTRALLHHSAHSVRTFEFTIPTTAGN